MTHSFTQKALKLMEEMLYFLGDWSDNGMNDLEPLMQTRGFIFKKLKKDFQELKESLNS